MNLQVAVKGMMEARAQLRSKQGVSDPAFISEQMQRLAQYNGAVEEHLAAMEEKLEIEEMQRFLYYSNEEKKSVNQSELLAKQEVGAQKGEIAKLKRYVNSSWQIVGVAQSRWNHLQKSIVGQI
jgi:hypothetical protein